MSPTPAPPHDQAQVLRTLARPGTPAAGGLELTSNDGSQAAVSSQALPLQHKVDNAPHVVLISETPSVQGGLSFALHLANCISETQQRVLLVDLAPAASRLGHAIAANPTRFREWAEHLQPLWNHSPHGRTLNAWKPTRSQVDVVAQLGTDFPTAEQMPRICEQLVRQLGQQRQRTSEQGPTCYSTVLLLSEFVGVPLDSAAWQAADEVWLLHEAAVDAEQMRAHLSARLSPRFQGQRLVLLGKQTPKLRNWAARRRVESAIDRPQAVALAWPHAESFNVAWPNVPSRLARSMAGTARDAVRYVLYADSQPRSTRQAC